MDDKCRADQRIILMPQFYERKDVEIEYLRFFSLNNIREWPAVQNDSGLGIASLITVSQGFPQLKSVYCSECLRDFEWQAGRVGFGV